MRRGSGVLLHISSLPGPYGIGTLGHKAFEFVDRLHEAEQTYWQILPCTPPGYGNSPYQSISAFAGNPSFIDLDLLVENGLLDKEDLDVFPPVRDESVAELDLNTRLRLPLLMKAAKRGIPMYASQFEDFKHKQEHWLHDYAVFRAFRQHFETESFREWPDEIRHRDPAAESKLADELRELIEAAEFAQFLFSYQWNALKEYANGKQIQIIGDMPIYVSPDSVECWSHPHMFLEDCVAGVPPDAFSATGQEWGNPIYSWEYMRSTGFEWWIQRVGHLMSQYDYVRFDHFRGIESYYVIPTGKTPLEGHWELGPGQALIDALRARLGQPPIIAEDLGFLTQGVYDLLAYCAFPGTKVLQFGFGELNSMYLPHNCPKNCVIYTGTHDNNTTLGWFDEVSDHEKRRIQDYTGMEPTEKNINDTMSRLAQLSPADCAIIPMQDILGLGSWARMNFPSVPLGNWKWRMKESEFTQKMVKRMRKLARVYGRGYYDRHASN